MAARRLFAVPHWTERAALLAIGAWTLAYAATRALEAVNTAGSFLLPDVPTGPNSWRPAQPLGDLPFDLQVPLMRVSTLLPLALVGFALATWRDASRRRRLLAMLALVDVLLVVLAYQALVAGQPRTNAMSYALHQLAVAPLVGLGVALAWPTRRGRGLALAGAALLAFCYANVYWMSHGITAASWWAAPGRMAALSVALAFARALAPALIGAGILLAGRALRPASPSGSSGAAGAPAGPSTR